MAGNQGKVGDHNKGKKIKKFSNSGQFGKGLRRGNWKGGISVGENKKNYSKEYIRRSRVATLQALGGKCLVCGFNDQRALQIDHINGGGSKERKECNFSKSFHKHVLISFLNKENKYQLLCANCNWIKRFEKNEARGRFT